MKGKGAVTLTFPRMRGSRFVRYVLPAREVELLRQYRQRPNQNEMGGVLAGWLRRTWCGDTWMVSHFSLPSSAHAAGPAWFQLHQPTAQRYLDELFAASKGRVYFCGFWHTHPEPCPSHSPPDRRVIADLFANGKLEIITQLGLIVGNEGVLYGWCQRANGTVRENKGARFH